MSFERDRHFEQDATREYAQGLDVEHLIAYAERRADVRGDFVWIEVEDLHRNILEELADARNYLIWLMLAIQRYDLDIDPEPLCRALAALIQAWKALTS